MATKVFISWSGPLSQQLGEALRNWLPSALQFVKPYFSPEDIEKGAKWNAEISKELETSTIGLICLTPENLEKPWILFEAGALSKSLDKSRVCTILFQLDPAEITGPLTSFQATKFLRDDFKRLFTSINSSAGEARLESNVLDQVFDMWWPKLEQDVSIILQNSKNVPAKTRRQDRDILEEILELTRINSSRSLRPRIHEQALLEILEAVDELQFILQHENEELGHSVVKRLDRPLRHLCMEAGLPYSRFRFRGKNRRRPTVDQREMEDITPPVEEPNSRSTESET